LRTDPLRYPVPQAVRESVAVAPGATVTVEAQPVVEATVSDKPWSDFTAADYDVAQYHRACLIHNHEGAATSKSQCSLPVREPDGTLNRNGVHAAAARIGQVNTTAAKKAAARKALRRLYGQLDEEPPDSLSDEAARPAAGRRTAIRETPTLLREVASNGHIPIQLIKAGWSLNGNYYPAEVLRRDGPAAWPAGTLNYVDHDTDAEEEARPAGSLMRLASYQTTAARWDEDRQALVAEVRPFAPWREAVEDWARSGAIGMSIRAWVYGEDGEAEGRKGFIVSAIPQGRSVDYVTVPAAGGALLSAMESVRRRSLEARNIGVWLESRLHLTLTQFADDMYGSGRLTREERIALSGAIGAGLQAWTAHVEQAAPQLFRRDLYDEPDEMSTQAADEARATAEAPTDETRTALMNAIRAAYADADAKTWAWLKDFDPETSVVWFEADDGDGSTCWQQSYAIGGDGGASLTGDRVEVVARTVYQPVSAPGSGDAAEAAPASTLTATAVIENVTDGAPPTASNPPIKEEPVSGTQAGAPPVQAGTATVVDTPPVTAPPTPAVEAAPAPVVAPVVEAQPDAQTVAALEAVTAQLGEMQKSLAAVNARADQRDAENRALRNTNRASEAITAALRAPEFADVAGQIGTRVSARVLADVPTTTEGVVDEAKLTEAITAAVTDEASYVRTTRAEALEEAGVGLPRGLGSAPAVEADDGFDAELGEFFSDVLGMSEAQSKVAVKGRNN
jgi:hypothetical protein